MRSSEHAQQFIHRLWLLAERLAAKNLVVASLVSDWAGFGSWKVEVQHGEAADAYGEALKEQNFDSPGPKVMQFFWDERDGRLTIDTAPTEPLCSPGPWERLLDITVDGSDRAVRFVEDYLETVDWSTNEDPTGGGDR